MRTAAFVHYAIISLLAWLVVFEKNKVAGAALGYMAFATAILSIHSFLRGPTYERLISYRNGEQFSGFVDLLAYALLIIPLISHGHLFIGTCYIISANIDFVFRMAATTRHPSTFPAPEP